MLQCQRVPILLMEIISHLIAFGSKFSIVIVCSCEMRQFGIFEENFISYDGLRAA